LLPVVTSNAVSAYDLLSPLDGLVMAKDVAGTGVFWPEYNINTLGSLNPGKAYFVKTNAQGVVDFTSLKSNGNFETQTGFPTLSGLDLDIIPTPVTHTIAILPAALENIPQESVIAVFDNDDNCFGAAVYDGEAICLTVFGSDPISSNKAGFSEGAQMRFKILNPETGETAELNPQFTPDFPSNDGTFSENGLSMITAFQNATTIADYGNLNNIRIFPNPSSGATHIKGLLQGSTVIISNMHGQSLMTINVKETDILQIDLTGFPAGVYFINVQFDRFSTFQKLILR
jgi:hypothetical protein